MTTTASITPTTIAACGLVGCFFAVFLLSICLRARDYTRCSNCGDYLNDDIHIAAPLCTQCALNTALFPNPVAALGKAPETTPSTPNPSRRPPSPPSHSISPTQICMTCRRIRPPNKPWGFTWPTPGTPTIFEAQTCPDCSLNQIRLTQCLTPKNQ